MGKVFIFDSAVKRWKDRGRGQIKLNRTPPAVDDYHDLLPATTAPQKQSARFIMRTEGTYTLVLNSPVYQGMKIGELDGSPPTGQNLQLMAMEGGVPTTTTLKVCERLLDGGGKRLMGCSLNRIPSRESCMTLSRSYRRSSMDPMRRRRRNTPIPPIRRTNEFVPRRPKRSQGEKIQYQLA